ncbi:MAG: cytochrome c3 family protein [Sulfurimonas sp.]|nr:cytochrome c3 family protein [Sulfurimonas sp.]
MINNKISVLAAILLISSAVFAGDGTNAGTSGTTAYGGESVTAASSPHNLSATGPGTGVSGDNGEVCVYCHTPHAANIDFTGAPIWNKESVAGQTFDMYGGGASGAGTVAGTKTLDTPANSSLACLSCHDGVSAIDSIVNAPGSGMGSLASGTAGVAGTINGIATVYGGNIGGDLGVLTSGNIDLSNDHPVSIQYIPGRASLRAITDTLPVGTGGAWKTADGGTTVASLLRGAAGDRVECASCHDPHNATGVAQATALQVNYLRHSNVQSELCFGCHDK